MWEGLQRGYPPRLNFTAGWVWACLASIRSLRPKRSEKKKSDRCLVKTDARHLQLKGSTRVSGDRQPGTENLPKHVCTAKDLVAGLQCLQKPSENNGKRELRQDGQCPKHLSQQRLWHTLAGIERRYWAGGTGHWQTPLANKHGFENMQKTRQT